MGGGKHPSIVLAGFTLLASVSGAFAVTLAGISAGGSIYEIDLSTGQAVNPWDTGLGSTVGMSLSPGGALYVLSNRDAPVKPAWLYAIGAAHAVAPIGPTGLPLLTEGDIAFDPVTGVLYGAYDALDNDRRLFTLSIQTGAATFLPVSPGGDISALACDDQGVLYGLDTALSRLLTLDKVTGNALASVNLSRPLGSTAGMSFDPDTGTLYVADGGSGGSTLYTLNPTTGALTAIGPTGVPGGLTGLAFVPEPSTLLLVFFGAVTAVRRRK